MINSTAVTRLALRIRDLSQILDELDSATKAEIKAAMVSMYVPDLPARKGIKGAAPLDNQLIATASSAEQVMHECDNAAIDYDRLANQATTILRSTVIKSIGDMAEAGKAKAQERRDECERMAQDARAELERRQKAREEAMAELEKAQEAAREVERIRKELTDMRATFA